jgi:hypothetical protein
MVSKVSPKRRRMKIKLKRRRRQKIQKLKEKYSKAKSQKEKDKILEKLKRISPFYPLKKIQGNISQERST